MTRYLPSHQRLPVAALGAAAVLAAGGLALLAAPSLRTAAPAVPPARDAASATSPPAGAAPPGTTPRGAGAGSPPAASASGSAHATARTHRSGEALPPPDAGPRADAAIRRALEQATPPDVPGRDAVAAVRVGRAVWLAETTGVGRERWPGYFTAAEPGCRPYTRVRIQAAVARRAGVRRLVVHLVWAGRTPGGQYQQDRPAQVLLDPTRRHGRTVWTPVR